jgi:hypothetical protein
MRGISSWKWVATAFAIALLWLPGAAQAAFAPVEAELLAHTNRIEESSAWVSPTGEQLVLYRELEPRQSLDARARTAGTNFGPVQSLTQEGNFELPRSVSFTAGGEAFASWGIATVGVHGEFSTRAPGGLFEPRHDNSVCSRFATSSVGPQDELILACDQEVSPGKFRVVLPEASSFAAFPGGAIPLGPVVESEFLAPKVRRGDDGTLAIGWDYQTGGEQFAEVAVRDAGSKVSPTVQNLIHLPTAGGGEARVEDIAVTANGTVIVLVSTSTEGLLAYIRPSGGSFTATKLAAVNASGAIGVDAAGNAIVLVESGIGPTASVQYALRPPGGAFTVLQDVVPTGSADGATLNMAPDGTAFAELFHQSSRSLDVAVRPPNGSFAAPLQVVASGLSFAKFALTPTDDLLATWTSDTDGDHTPDTVFVGGLDSGTPPQLTAVDVPAATVTGTQVTFSAGASDTMGVRGVQWSFGDGSSAAGASVSHAYTSAGVFTVTVTATDRAGNTSSLSRAITVISPPATSTGPAGAGGPVITLKMPGSVRFKSFLTHGLTIEVSSSTPATVIGNLLGRSRSARLASVGDLVVASRTLKNVTTHRKLLLRPSRLALGRRRSLRLTVQIVATDAHGLQRTATRKLNVKR